MDNVCGPVDLSVPKTICFLVVLLDRVYNLDDPKVIDDNCNPINPSIADHISTFIDRCIVDNISDFVDAEFVCKFAITLWTRCRFVILRCLEWEDLASMANIL